MCELHKSHTPLVHSTDRHHIQPVSWDGPDEDNIAVICPTGHRSVHILLRELMLCGEIRWETGKHFGSAERRMAEDGYARYLVMKGSPTAQSRSILAQDASYSGGSI